MQRRAPARVLFLSNGHGEDTVGAEIARRLRQREPAFHLAAVPVVGGGEPYRRLGVPIPVRTETMPSGGLIYAGRQAVWRDVRHGVLSLLADQVRTLRRLAPGVDMVVGVGDKVILYMERLFLRRPLAFVGVAYSAHYTDGRPVYGSGLRRILNKFCPLVYARDAKTAAQLREQGVAHATFVGNPMMDCFEVTGDDFGLAAERPVVGLLPGSREEAYGNLPLLLEAVAGVDGLASAGSERPAFVAALAPSLALGRIAKAAAPGGWRLEPGSAAEPGPGVVAALVGPAGTRVKLVRGRFGDVISRADVVIGLAGTANEQAAGLGKPVVTFPGTGEQTPRRFVYSQRRLLGDAVHIARPTGDAVARDVYELLRNPQRRERMGRDGRQRMGSPGGVDRIVEDILEYLGRAKSESRTRQ